MTTVSDTDCLLARVLSGDTFATDELLDRYRDRLGRLVSLRLDDRVAGRLDASDVVQDTLMKAAKHLETYARSRPVAFYPWLRKIAIDRIVELHREHIRAKRRSVNREASGGVELSGAGRRLLVGQLVGPDANPSRQARLKEEMERTSDAIDQLAPRDREVLVLRYVEQLSVREASEVLEINENTFAQRHLRALRRIRVVLARMGDVE